MRSSNNLPVHELIDMAVEVKESSDPSLIGISGKVMDETKNTLLIEKCDGKMITVQKNMNVFEFKFSGNERVLLSGGDIAYRPQDRIKKINIKKNVLKGAS
jgi:ribonuclease P protein subunit POP4